MAEPHVEQDLGASVYQGHLDTERRKWLTIEETVYILRTSRDTIFKLIHTNRVPVLKEGKVIRIHVDDLNRCRRTMEEWREL